MQVNVRCGGGTLQKMEGVSNIDDIKEELWVEKRDYNSVKFFYNKVLLNHKPLIEQGVGNGAAIESTGFVNLTVKHDDLAANKQIISHFERTVSLNDVFVMLDIEDEQE
jgi:hypothetical protein